MRALWKGVVAFGLVSVPVKMYAATEDHDVRFHQVHAEDGGRIRMKRECEVCGKQLSYSEIAKGYEDPSGQRIIMDPSDLEELPVSGGRDIDVVEFVPTEQVDPILFDRTYYLEPEGRAAKPYVLLREALASTDRTAIVKVAIRQRTQLACLRVRDGVLVLQTMKWPDEIRAADFDFLAEEPGLRPQELQMAESLIETMAGDFDPTQFTDEYREALLAVIENKLSGGQAIPAPAATAEPETGQVVDLMAALRESVARSQAARGGATADADVSDAADTDGDGDGAGGGAGTRSTPARKAPTRRAPARKAAPAATKKTASAKKAPAKVTAAKKTTPAKSTPAKSTAAKTTAAKTAAKTTAAKKSTAAKAPAKKAPARKRSA